MGRQRAGQAQFSYSFHLEERVPASDLLRKIDVFVSQALADVHRKMASSTAISVAHRSIPSTVLSSRRVNPVSDLLT